MSLLFFSFNFINNIIIHLLLFIMDFIKHILHYYHCYYYNCCKYHINYYFYFPQLDYWLMDKIIFLGKYLKIYFFYLKDINPIHIIIIIMLFIIINLIIKIFIFSLLFLNKNLYLCHNLCSNQKMENLFFQRKELFLCYVSVLITHKKKLKLNEYYI